MLKRFPSGYRLKKNYTLQVPETYDQRPNQHNRTRYSNVYIDLFNARNSYKIILYCNVYCTAVAYPEFFWGGWKGRKN